VLTGSKDSQGPEGRNIDDQLSIIRNALMLATLCGAASPFVNHLSEALLLSNDIRRGAMGLLACPFGLSMIATVAGVYSVDGGNTAFTAACVLLCAIIGAFVPIGIAVSFGSDAGMP
jgi:hypothetical protein